MPTETACSSASILLLNSKRSSRMATPSPNKPVSKHNSSPQSSAKAAADDDVDDSEPVESGVKGEAKKDMKNVTNYVNEELAQRQVDANKLGKVSVNKG